jgi:cytochrome P450
LLAKHPDVRERLGEEIERVLGGKSPQESDTPNLTYTRMVLDETMRLYPPAWLTNRKSLRDDEIDGYVIPAGAEIAVIPYVTHRDPDLWPEPEKFDPERFTPEKKAERHRYAFFPFGAGPRLCIGNNFAILEAQLILAAICQRFAPELVPGHEVEPEALITLRPKNGLWMHIKTK